MSTEYNTLHTNARWWVKHQDDLIGGYSANDLRTYVFPLYTPGGVLVLQEAPPDHPHHQGVHVGLSIDGHDVWNAGSFGRPRHAQRSRPPLKELQPEIAKSGVTFTHQVHWTTDGGQELLREERQVTFSRRADFCQIRWRSAFNAAAQPLTIDQTKEAGIALRVPPHWETIFGGRILNAHGDVGEAACFDKASPWLNIQGGAGGDRMAGVVFAPAPESEPCPWFTRDYGEHVYNPTRHHPIALAPGQTFTWAVNVLAYDGDVTVEQIDAMVREVDG